MQKKQNEVKEKTNFTGWPKNMYLMKFKVNKKAFEVPIFYIQKPQLVVYKV